MDAWNIGADVHGVLDDDANPHVPMPGDEGFHHWLIYVAWLALRSDTVNVNTLADDGTIHEAMHLHEGVPTVGDDALERYLDLCRKLHLLPPQ